VKPTWLFLSLVIISANLPIKDDISVVDGKTRHGISDVRIEGMYSMSRRIPRQSVTPPAERSQ
jgi:hypothetical protein